MQLLGRACLVRSLGLNRFGPRAAPGVSDQQGSPVQDELSFDEIGLRAAPGLHPQRSPGLIRP